MDTAPFFIRSSRLLGLAAFARLRRVKVVVFGVGGVGSWCAEALVRTGVTDITIVDADRVDPSNVNRQLEATTSTIGTSKVEAMKRRLLEINPSATVTAVDLFFDRATAGAFDFDSYDYVVDAIDSLPSKALLIDRATASRARLFSSMGAAGRTDSTRVAVAEFWKVAVCPLARALRVRFRRAGADDPRPRRPFLCVYSEESVRPTVAAAPTDGARSVPGSIVTVTAAFGLALASLIINHVAAEGPEIEK